MRLCLLITYFIMGVISTVSAQDFDQNHGTAILMFDTRGGQKPRTADGPVLKIYADGTVVARAEKPGDPPIVGYLSQEEQVAFFQELVYDTGILDMTTSSIQNEITMQNSQLRQFPGAPVTFLYIHLPKGSTSISIKGVSILAYLVPEAASIQKLYFIQRSLFNFVKRINAEAS